MKYSNIRHTILFLSVFSFVLISIYVIYLNVRNRCDELRCITFSLLDQKTNREIYEKTEKSFLALYTLPRLFVRVEKRTQISKQDAETLTKITIMRLQGQFETARSPYPGFISDAIRCDEKFEIQPSVTQNGSHSSVFFRGYLNDRMQYGSCIDAEIQYTGLNAIIYCENHDSWYRIEALIPTDASDEISSITQKLQLISCQ